MSNVVSSWPPVPGSYVVGDPNSPVAVCTLTTERLMGQLATFPGVAISGMVYTANLGIQRIIVNITSNPAIRFLLVCGRDSQLFKPGQSIVSLAENGVNDEKRIIGATGHEPFLQTITSEQIGQFRKQIEVVDWTGEEDPEALKKRISELSARSPGPFSSEMGDLNPEAETFSIIRPGGQRDPLIYDPKGYFVISIDSEKGEIVLKHYLTDHTPAQEMRGRGATSMLLGLLRDGLVTQLSHAGYLGEELAKAQVALQFGLRYDQDRLLRPKDATTNIAVESPTQPSKSQSPAPAPAATQVASKMPKIPLTLKQFLEAQVGTKADFALSVAKLTGDRTLEGAFLEMDETELFSAYHKTSQPVIVSWNQTSKMIMGQENEIQAGALIRVYGTMMSQNAVKAEQVIILTKAARILP